MCLPLVDDISLSELTDSDTGEKNTQKDIGDKIKQENTVEEITQEVTLEERCTDPDSNTLVVRAEIEGEQQEKCCTGCEKCEFGASKENEMEREIV